MRSRRRRRRRAIALTPYSARSCGRSSSPTCISEAAPTPTCCAATTRATRSSRALDGVDRLVLLGDVLELRHGPVARRAARRRGRRSRRSARAMAGGEVVLIAGNHDHALVSPVARRGARSTAPGRSGSRSAPGADASPRTAAMARDARARARRRRLPGRLAARRRLRDARPLPRLPRHGPDVRAPRRRRRCARSRGRADRRAPTTTRRSSRPSTPGWTCGAQTGCDFGAERQRGTQNAWRTSHVRSGDGPLRARAFAAAFPSGGWRSSTGSASARCHRRLAARAAARRPDRDAGERRRRWGIDARWVIFGHTPPRRPARPRRPFEWRGLMNSGSWVYEEVFLGASPRRSPSIGPGGAVEVDPRRLAARDSSTCFLTNPNGDRTAEC